MSNKDIIFIIGTVALLILLLAIRYLLDRQGFHKGTCPHCNHPLFFFDTDSAGERGYYCKSCHYTTWVAYDSIDKDYQESKGENRC